MIPPPTAPDDARLEFAALRATVRERGTVRLVLLWLSLVAWAVVATALVIAGRLAGDVPVFTLVPLLVLAAGFETTLALHVGVERIGRYLQVFHEERQDWCGWEHAAMAYGQRHPGGSDPLLTAHVLIAAALNLLPTLLVGEPIEVAAIGAAHVLFAGRVLRSRFVAARQRAVDLDRFRVLRAELPARPRE